MGFRSDHPDYMGYESDDFYVNELPGNFTSALEGYITRNCDSTQQLKSVVHDIESRIPMELTQNWGWDFLISDLSVCVSRLRKVKFHKVMDFLSDFYSQHEHSIELEDFNEFIEELELGYKLDGASWCGYSWVLRENVTSRAESVSDASSSTKDICTQTFEHLDQAKQHLLETKTDRDRKDAVRDCMSAMESMLKNLSGENNIKDATKALRQSGNWGPDTIVKEGLSIWDRLHSLHPDIRHGSPNVTTITDEEAIYWVERISCFICYLAKRHRQLNSV